MSGILLASVGASYGSLPVNTVAPVISGTAAVGQTLSVTTGTWTGIDPITYTYQWQKGTTNISGATSSTFTITLSQVGSTIRCVVTATDSSGSASANSANTSSVPTPTIGAAADGGYYAGQISVAGNGVASHYLVVSPRSTGFTQLQWKNANTATSGADSVINGPQNTADMVADGSSTVYPAAHFCNNLTIGGYTDWYMPSINEIEVCYFNLKPTTYSNNTSYGINPNAVPARASNYTSGTPARTSASLFQSGGAQAFVDQSFWSSTEATASTGTNKAFIDGAQETASKTGSRYIRAIRRVPV